MAHKLIIDVLNNCSSYTRDKLGIIRLLLAIAVCNSHYELTTISIVDGHEAVLTFFAVSGFYMGMILDQRELSILRFYKNRLLSLYPIYLFAITLSAALLFFFDIHPLLSRSQMSNFISNPIGLIIVLWTSFCVVGQELLFSLAISSSGHISFLTTESQSIYNTAFLVQAWSLSLEIMFYLIAPFLLRMGKCPLFFLSTASLLLRIIINCSYLSEYSYFLRFFPADFWLFGFGIISYHIYKTLPKRIHVIDYLSFISLIVLIFIAGSVNSNLEPFFLPIGALTLQPFIFRLFRSNLLDCIVGKTTYPFYLLHFSVIALFEEYSEDPIGWQILSVTLLAATITFLIFNFNIEKLKLKIHRQPIDRLIIESI